jgi:NAD(P)H-quinone oxidoreductase subunit 4
MLSLLLLIPGAIALLLPFLPSPLVRRTALFAALGLIVVTLVLLRDFDPSLTIPQLAVTLPWLPPLGLNFNLAIDGLSLPLVLLTQVLTVVAISATPVDIARPRLFYAMVFAVNAGLTGSFLAHDLLLFVIFYELELIPLYILIAIWGSAKRNFAATKFLIFNAISGGLLLVGALATGLLSSRPLNFDLSALHPEAVGLPLQITLCLTLLAAFAIKLPLVPFHTWQPDAYSQSSPPVAMLLAGVVSKLGAYGLIRFCVELFPQSWIYLGPVLAWAGAFSAVYGALNALLETDLKRLVAYGSIGSLGYLLLAASTATPLALQGAVVQMVGHGLILALLFYVVGLIEAKTGTTDRRELSGLLNAVRGLPLTSGLLVMGVMAIAGIPGMVGFVGEFLIFQASFGAHPGPTIACIFATGLTAVYSIALLNKVCFGRLDNQKAYYPRVLLSEQIPALALTGLIVLLGIWPQWLLHWSEPATGAIASSQRLQDLATALQSRPPSVGLAEPPLAPPLTPAS